MSDEKEPSKEALAFTDALGCVFPDRKDQALLLDAWGEALLKRQALPSNPVEPETTRGQLQRGLDEVANVLGRPALLVGEHAAAVSKALTTEKAAHAVTRPKLHQLEGYREVTEAELPRLRAELEATRKERERLGVEVHSLTCARIAVEKELEPLRKPLEGELARKLETVRESLLEYVGTPNSAELHALDAIEAELSRLRSNAKPVGVAGYPGMRAEFCRACANYPCNCAASLEGELAEDVERVRGILETAKTSVREWPRNVVLACEALDRIALRAKGAELEACGELNTKLTAALLDEKTRNASEGWVKHLPGFREKAKGEPQAVEPHYTNENEIDAVERYDERRRVAAQAAEPPEPTSAWLVEGLRSTMAEATPEMLARVKAHPSGFIQPPEPRPIVHELKTWPEAFDAVESGVKRFEWRKENDRHFRPGDTLRLFRYDPRRGQYTGHELRARVTFVLRGQYGIPDGYCVMSIDPEPAAPAPSLKGMPVTIDDSDPPAAPAPELPRKVEPGDGQ